MMWGQGQIAHQAVPEVLPLAGRLLPFAVVVAVFHAEVGAQVGQVAPPFFLLSGGMPHDGPRIARRDAQFAGTASL